MLKTIFHEVLHGLGHAMNLKMLKNEDNHDELDVLAGALVDTMIRNGWMEIDESEEAPCD